MSRKKELRQLSKNQLIRLLLEEREARQGLEKQLKKIQHYLKAFDNAHTPSSKQLKKNTKDKKSEDESNDKSSDENKKKPRFPGKP